jgi:hypothetical protein
MSRLEIVIASKVLWSTGDVKLWVDIPVRLKDSSGAWQPELLRVDTATEITTFSAHDAWLLGLPMPLHATTTTTHQQTGLVIRSGYLRFQIVGLDPTEYVTPCLFLGDPHTPPAGPAATLPRKLLQPFALLGQLRFGMDHDPSDGTPYGMLVVENK